MARFFIDRPIVAIVISILIGPRSAWWRCSGCRSRSIRTSSRR